MRMPNVMRCDYCFSLRNVKNWTGSRRAEQKLGFSFFVLFDLGAYILESKKSGKTKGWRKQGTRWSSGEGDDSGAEYIYISQYPEFRVTY